MKLVLTLNELKSSQELLKRVGVSMDSLKTVVDSMKDGETLTQRELVYKLDLSAEAIAKLNKNPNVMSVVKHFNGAGVTCLTIIISEEFIMDTNTMYGDCIVEAVEQIKVVVKTLSVFFKGKVKEYLDKWDLK